MCKGPGADTNRRLLGTERRPVRVREKQSRWIHVTPKGGLEWPGRPLHTALPSPDGVMAEGPSLKETWAELEDGRRIPEMESKLQAQGWPRPALLNPARISTAFRSEYSTDHPEITINNATCPNTKFLKNQYNTQTIVKGKRF